MAQIRNYQKGVFETKPLSPISQVTDSTNTFLQFDGILTNAFSNLVLYADAGGASPLPLTSYDPTTTDDTATALEAETSTGGSGYTVYSQFKVTDATYQNVDLYATFTNFGTYTDNDAAFNQIGAEVEISSSQTVALSDGAIQTLLTVDTSSGDVTATLPSGDFVGQRITVICSGANIAYVEDYALISGDSASFVWDSSLWVTEVPRMVRACFSLDLSETIVAPKTLPIDEASTERDTHSIVKSTGLEIPLTGLYTLDVVYITQLIAAGIFRIRVYRDGAEISNARGASIFVEHDEASSNQVRGTASHIYEFDKGDVITFYLDQSPGVAGQYLTTARLNITYAGLV